MKKILSYIAFGAATIVSASCSVNQMTPQVSSDTRVQMEFTAGTVDTKTSINDLEVLWSAGDAISVFDGTNNNRFNLTGGEGTKSATFSGLAETVSEYVALYPFSANASFAGNTITATLPVEQYSTVGGSFDTMLNPAVAKSSDNTLTFRNIAGLIRINVTNVPEGLGIREIQAKAATSLTGEYTVNTSGDDFEAVASGSEVNGVRLVAKDGGELAEGAYNLVVLPGEYANFKVTVILTDGSYIAKGGENAPVATIPANGGINITIDASTATANTQGLYGLYQAGASIEIGDKVYTPEELNDFGKVTHITTDNASTNLSSGVYFIDSDVTIENTSARGWNKIMLIGNDTDTRTKINLQNYIAVNNADGQFICANIEFTDTRTSGAYMFTSNYNGGYESVVFDNCKFNPLLGSAIFTANSSDFQRYLNNIALENCIISAPAYEKGTGNSCRAVAVTGAQIAGATINSISFKNNIIYCNNGFIDGYQLFLTPNNTNVTVNNIILENNTLVNITPRTDGLVSTYNLNRLSMQNNIFWIEDMQNVNYLIIRCYGTFPAGDTCTNNIAYAQTYGSTETRRYFTTFYNNSGWDGAQNVQVLSETPFDSNFDIATENFTPIAEYASYGAQR